MMYLNHLVIGTYLGFVIWYLGFNDYPPATGGKTLTTSPSFNT